MVGTGVALGNLVIHTLHSVTTELPSDGSDGTRSTSDNILTIDGVLLLPPEIAASDERI